MKRRPDLLLWWTLGMVMGFVPRRHRFRIAWILARGLEPLIARTLLYHRRAKVNAPRDIALERILTGMNWHAVEYDVPLHVEGREYLSSALGSGRGVLFVGVHAALNPLVIRHLNDCALDPTFVLGPPRGARYWGSKRAVRTIRRSQTFLISIRDRLRTGEIVCADVDWPSHDRRTVEVHTRRGPVFIADALLRVALRCKAHIVFTTTRADPQQGIITTFSGPSVVECSPAAATKEFAEFVHAHVEAISGHT
jgi:lauroyl/myristoyl acyltransferase